MSNLTNLTSLTRRRNLFIGAGFAALLGALVIGQAALQKTVAAQNAGVMAPHFEVDPLWPKPLPNLSRLALYPRSDAYHPKPSASCRLRRPPPPPKLRL